MAATAAERWAQRRSFHHSRYAAERIAADREVSVTVCLPARECAATIAPTVASLVRIRELGAIDEVLVVDAASSDGTATLAERAGARVLQEGELMPEHGPVLGKGDAMWRALGSIGSDVVVFLDADVADFSPHFAVGLIGPLVEEPDVSFVKAFYERPLTHGDVEVPGGGGRVNHLLARPALTLFYPELAAIRQPLAGEIAARRELLLTLPFTTGYGVEVAMLIDAWRSVGLDGLAQVDLGLHRNRSQPLAALAPMAATVLATIARRVSDEGRLRGVPDAAPPERPSHDSLALA
jgi:glucosyl-3-phosphoglycerate synthase